MVTFRLSMKSDSEKVEIGFGSSSGVAAVAGRGQGTVGTGAGVAAAAAERSEAGDVISANGLGTDKVGIIGADERAFCTFPAFSLAGAVADAVGGF